MKENSGLGDGITNRKNESNDCTNEQRTSPISPYLNREVIQHGRRKVDQKKISHVLHMYTSYIRRLDRLV